MFRFILNKMGLFNFKNKGRKFIEEVVKSTANEFYFNNFSRPEEWGGSTFYPLRYSRQNSKALIQMYNDLPEVSAPVNLLIDTLSIIPFGHYQIKGNERNEVLDSPYMNILNNPNQFQTKNNFIKSFFLNRIMLGAGYINYVKAFGFEAAGQLYVLPTENTEPVINKNETDLRINEVTGYKTSWGHGQLTLNKDEVFVSREACLGNTSLYEPRSRVMTGILTSRSLRNNYDARIKLLADSGARVIISPANQNATLTPQEAKELRKSYAENMGMIGNKTPSWVTSRAVDVQNVSLNSQELELLQNKSTDMQTICNVLSIDPVLFGIGTTTYNNKKLAKTSFYEDVIQPMFDDFLYFMQTVLGMPAGEILEADYRQISAMQEDYKSIVEASSKAYNDNAISELEYRTAIGLQGGEDKKKMTIENELQTNQTTGQG